MHIIFVKLTFNVTESDKKPQSSPFRFPAKNVKVKTNPKSCLV